MKMKLWIVSMECAGICEAGGVKNVTYSLCKEASVLNNKVTLFIPVFKCNTWELIQDYKDFTTAEISICGKTETVKYATALCKDGNFNVVFIRHSSFEEKEEVYTYTKSEEEQNPLHVKGHGHEDLLYKDILFQKAVCQYGALVSKTELPDIIHCQDAACASLPGFIKENQKIYKKTHCVVTIHNAGPAYHHNFSCLGEAAWCTGLSTELLEKCVNGKSVEPFLIAAECGAYLTTVSEEYANEIVDPKNVELTDGLAPIFAKRNIEIKGITNGFDFDRYNPSNKEVSFLPFEYSPEVLDLDGKLKCRKFFIQNVVNTEHFKTPGIKKYGKLECSTEYTKEIYLSYHGRITGQKGIDVLIESIPAVINNFPQVRFILAGQGDTALENQIIELTDKFPGKICYMNGYNKVVARLSVAVCDFIVLPSYFEPCGLEDFSAQVYGTIPVAHKTGGLNKIIDSKTGFLYNNNTSEELIAKLSEVIMYKELKPNMINKMIKTAAVHVHKEYYWPTVVQKKYLSFFKEILKK